MAKANPATVPQGIVSHPLQGNFCKQSRTREGDHSHPLQGNFCKQSRTRAGDFCKQSLFTKGDQRKS